MFFCSQAFEILYSIIENKTILKDALHANDHKTTTLLATQYKLNKSRWFLYQLNQAFLFENFPPVIMQQSATKSAANNLAFYAVLIAVDYLAVFSS